MTEPKQPQVANQQPRHAGFPTPPQTYYYPYLYSWPSWPPAQQPSGAPPPHSRGPGMLSHETASKQLLDMGLPAFSSMAGKQQTTMQSSLTNGPHKSSKTAVGAQPQHQEQADPYLTRLLQPPPRRQVWSAQPRSAWRAPQPTQSKPAPKVVSSQHAPGPPSALPPTPPITTTTNPRAIKDALGVDVYLHFREVLLRQQETLTHQLWELHRLAQLQRHLVSMSSESSAVIDVVATLERAAAPPRPPPPPPTTLQQTAGQLSISPIELPMPTQPIKPLPLRNRDGSGSSSGSPTGQHGQSRPPAAGTSGGNDESGKHGSGQHNSCQASNPEQQAADAGATAPAAVGGSTGDGAPPATKQATPGVSPPLLSGYSSVPPSAFAHPTLAAYGAMAPHGVAAMDPMQAWYHQHYSSMMMSQAAFGGRPKEEGMPQWWGDPMAMFGASMPTTTTTRTKRTRSEEEPPTR